MTAMTEPSNPIEDEQPAHGRGWRIASAILGVIALGLAVALILVLVTDDDVEAPGGTDASSTSTTSVDTSSTLPATSTSAADTTTTVPDTTTSSTSATTSTSSTTTAPTTSDAPTTVPSTQPPAEDLDAALWPRATGPVGYTDPVALVQDFAEEFVGMDDPAVGAFRPGDSRSGEVEVRADAGATLATTVSVRQLGPNDLWWVIGAATENITVDTPEALEVVSSPLELTGSALAFEGTVTVTLWEDGATAPLATTFVTGSGAPPPGPFTGELTFGEPSTEGGALLFTSESGEDGSVVEFAALRVLFTA